jgi:hypothetical protein
MWSPLYLTLRPGSLDTFQTFYLTPTSEMADIFNKIPLLFYSLDADPFEQPRV